MFLCLLPLPVARSSSGRVTKSQGEEAILGGCSGHSKALAIFAAVAAAFSVKRDHSIANIVMQQKGSFGMPGKRK